MMLGDRVRDSMLEGEDKLWWLSYEVSGASSQVKGEDGLSPSRQIGQA